MQHGPSAGNPTIPRVPDVANRTFPYKIKMTETGALLGGGSAAMLFRDKWYGYDDALYAAARLLTSSLIVTYQRMTYSPSSQADTVPQRSNLKLPSQKSLKLSMPSLRLLMYQTLQSIPLMELESSTRISGA